MTDIHDNEVDEDDTEAMFAAYDAPDIVKLFAKGGWTAEERRALAAQTDEKLRSTSRRLLTAAHAQLKASLAKVERITDKSLNPRGLEVIEEMHRATLNRLADGDLKPLRDLLVRSSRH
ncbi:hypothetical protein GCM10011504_25030 [Siccirubricoccus deserti]|uniref:Uncharacterized protein n=1 Tax=Siccirubricoccus deserti TaxID=2013562 RepID=A0A9X0R594_9PROT|nr:hypothetical protein [Siccirubricoccus deserti]MBC4019185.1 hypothetical protein [Siccirubricoccus deserti]GGC45531.1 hypothetical protein GCM10011504_25030 [Siccirubricoccus deserti]